MFWTSYEKSCEKNSKCVHIMFDSSCTANNTTNSVYEDVHCSLMICGSVSRGFRDWQKTSKRYFIFVCNFIKQTFGLWPKCWNPEGVSSWEGALNVAKFIILNIFDLFQKQLISHSISAQQWVLSRKTSIVQIFVDLCIAYITNNKRRHAFIIWKARL